MTSEKSDEKQTLKTKDTMGNMLCTQRRRKINVPNKIISSSTDDETAPAEQTRRRVGQDLPKPTPSERSPILVSHLQSTPPAPPNVEVIPPAHLPVCLSTFQAARLGYAADAYPMPYVNSRHAVMAPEPHQYTPMTGSGSRMDWVPSIAAIPMPPAPIPRPLPRPPCTQTPAPSSGSWSISTWDSSASSSRWTPALSEPSTIHHRPGNLDIQHNGGTTQEPKYLDIDHILVRFRKLTRDGITPSRHTATGGVFILFCAYKATIPPYGTLNIPTDLQVNTPEGTYGEIQQFDGMGRHGALRIMEFKVRPEPIFVWAFNDDPTRPCNLNRGDPIATLTIKKDYNADATIEEINGVIHSI